MFIRLISSVTVRFLDLRLRLSSEYRVNGNMTSEAVRVYIVIVTVPSS